MLYISSFYVRVPQRSTQIHTDPERSTEIHRSTENYSAGEDLFLFPPEDSLKLYVKTQTDHIHLKLSCFFHVWLIIWRRSPSSWRLRSVRLPHPGLSPCFFSPHSCLIRSSVRRPVMIPWRRFSGRSSRPTRTECWCETEKSFLWFWIFRLRSDHLRVQDPPDQQGVSVSPAWQTSVQSRAPTAAWRSEPWPGSEPRPGTRPGSAGSAAAESRGWNCRSLDRSPETQWQLWGEEPQGWLSNQKQQPHLLVKVAEVVEVGVASAPWILIGAAGVRRPLHLCQLQPIGEVDHPTTLELRHTCHSQVTWPHHLCEGGMQTCHLCLEVIPGVRQPLMMLQAKVMKAGLQADHVRALHWGLTQ